MNNEIMRYIDEQKELYNTLLDFIDNNQENEHENNNFTNLISIFQDQKISESKESLKQLFRLISIIELNHHRHANFFKSIEQIFSYFDQSINKFFTSSELFEIFISNKRILLFFVTQKMIGFDDEDIQQFISKMREDDIKSFNMYFFNEIKPFISGEKAKDIEQNLYKIDSDVFDDFDKKRQIGENDSYVCQLIRQDSIIEFIIYVNKINMPLRSKVKMSIFETNFFLIDRKTTLIEYAAFFGSLQIFRYLIQNNVEMVPSL